jgi:putative nucleotidyltransferase with HDIG domain
MMKSDKPSGTNSTNSESTFKIFDSSDEESTQSLNLGSFIPAEISQTGSFDIRNLRMTQFGKFLQALNIPFIIISPGQRIGIEFVSERWERICRGTKDMGQNSFSALFPDQNSEMHARQIVHDVIMTRRPMHCTTSIRLKDHQIWGRLDFLSVKISGARFVLVTMQDLTFERKRQMDNERERNRLEQEKGELIGEVLELEDRLTREESLREKAEKQLANARSELLSSVASMMDRRDPLTTLHHRRVAQLANAISTRLNLNEDTFRTVIIAASVHDIGKFAWPDVVLREEKKADAKDWRLIRQHPIIGSDILKSLRVPERVSKAVLQHHEAMDGSGYPLGMEGANILLEARIIMVADSVEAMASQRPWRKNRFSREQIVKELLSNSTPVSDRYDRRVVDACVGVLEKGFAFTSTGRG